MTKRLVSCLYDEFHPFDGLDAVTSLAVSTSPNDLTKDDILIIHGGADIHPSLYGKGKGRSWVGNHPSQRDLVEWAMLQKAKELGIPIIGICRGAQLLCAFAGGHLIQHVNNHGGGFAPTHDVVTPDGITFKVNSVHHQMMQPQGTAHKLMGWAPEKLSDEYWLEDKTVEVENEPEFVHFTDVKGFAFQWHPEAMRGDCEATKYIMNYIQEHL